MLPRFPIVSWNGDMDSRPPCPIPAVVISKLDLNFECRPADLAWLVRADVASAGGIPAVELSVIALVGRAENCLIGMNEKLLP